MNSLRKISKCDLLFQGWCTFCLGNDFWQTLIGARKAKESDEEEKAELESKAQKSKSFALKSGKGHQPLLSLIAQLRPGVITRLIELHCEWAEDVEAISLEQALWLYALLASVEKPLHPDIESSLRSFVIVCSNHRGRINLEADLYAHLNLIICIVARYFGQVDLSD